MLTTMWQAPKQIIIYVDGFKSENKHEIKRIFQQFFKSNYICFNSDAFHPLDE